MLQRVFNNQIIRVREDDHYISATDMAKAAGKLFADWSRLESTKEFLYVLSHDMGYPISHFIQSRKGGNPQAQGTWVHPLVAVNFAQWAKSEFAAQVSMWVYELMTTGSVNLENSIDPVTGELKSLKEQYNRLEKEKEYYQTGMIKANMRASKTRKAAAEKRAMVRAFEGFEKSRGSKKEQYREEFYKLAEGKGAVDYRDLDELAPVKVPEVCNF